MADELTRYYLRQAGRGVGVEEAAVGPVYRGGFSRGQRGSGILTNALKGVWNWASPIFSSGARALGQQALNTGAKILTDASSTSGKNLGEIAKQRLTEGRDDIVKKMRGGGRKRRKGKRLTHKKRGGRKRKATRTKGDIFESI